MLKFALKYLLGTMSFVALQLLGWVPWWIWAYIFTSTMITWLYYIWMLSWRAKGFTKDNMPLWRKVVFGGFVVDDFLYNYTTGTLLFLQLPRRGEWLFTRRVSRTMYGVESWRKLMAWLFASVFLNPPSQKYLGVDHV